MSRALSLAHLTFAPLPPADAAQLAAELGCGFLGLRLAPAVPGGEHWPVATDKALLRRTIAGLREAGVGVFDVEIVRIGPTSTPPDGLASWTRRRSSARAPC